MRRGTPIVLSAPSGAGKTTLCREIMRQVPGLAFSISHTTRPPRPGERADVDYHFASETDFDGLVAGGHFLEWAHVHRRRYGTSRAATEAMLTAGVDVLFDIDVQGGRQIAKALPEAVLILILPPTMTSLATRLKKRHADTNDEIARRLAVAAQEIRSASFYTHVIINETLSTAAAELGHIILAERSRIRGREALLGEVLADMERATTDASARSP